MHRKPRPRWPKGTYMRLKSGAMLRALMDQHGKSCADVGRYAGVERSYIWKLTDGRKKTLLPERAVLIAELLQVPVEILFDPVVSITGGQHVTQRTPRPRKKAAA